MTMTDSEASMGLEMATSRKEREEQGLLSKFIWLEVEMPQRGCDDLYRTCFLIRID